MCSVKIFFSEKRMMNSLFIHNLLQLWQQKRSERLQNERLLKKQQKRRKLQNDEDNFI